MAIVKMKTLLIEDGLYTQPIIDMGYLREQLTKYVNRWVDVPFYDYNDKNEFIKIKSINIKKIEPQMYFIRNSYGPYNSESLFGGSSFLNSDSYSCIQNINISFLRQTNVYFKDISNINYVVTQNLLKIQSVDEDTSNGLKKDLVGINISGGVSSDNTYNYNYIEHEFKINENAIYMDAITSAYGTLDFNENGYRTNSNNWLMVIFYYDMIIQKKDGTDDIYVQVPAILPLHILNDFAIKYNSYTELSCINLKNDNVFTFDSEVPNGQLIIYYNKYGLSIKTLDGNYLYISLRYVYNKNTINLAEFIEFYNKQKIVVTYTSLFGTIPREMLENEENF